MFWIPFARRKTQISKFRPKAASVRKTYLSAEVVGFCRKWFVLAETFCFLQKKIVSADIDQPFCRKAAYLQNLPFLQKVTEMQRHFGLISAPSKSAETKIFLLSVDLY